MPASSAWSSEEAARQRDDMVINGRYADVSLSSLLPWRVDTFLAGGGGVLSPKKYPMRHFLSCEAFRKGDLINFHPRVCPGAPCQRHGLRQEKKK